MGRRKRLDVSFGAKRVNPEDTLESGLPREMRNRPKGERRLAVKPSLLDYARTGSEVAQGIRPENIPMTGMRAGKQLGPAIGGGLSALYDYARSTAPGQVVTDVLGAPARLGASIRENPSMLYELIPGSGTVQGIREGAQRLAEGDPEAMRNAAALAAFAGAMDVIPGGGKGANLAVKGAKELAEEGVDLAGKGAKELAVDGMSKEIQPSDVVRLLRSNNQDLFVRWSHGPKYDLAPNARSKDYQTGLFHDGLSANRLKPNDPYGVIARTLGEYEFHKTSPEVNAHIYSGKVLGRDSDNAFSIRPTEHLGKIPSEFFDDLRAGEATILGAFEDVNRYSAALQNDPTSPHAGYWKKALETAKANLEAADPAARKMLQWFGLNVSGLGGGANFAVRPAKGVVLGMSGAPRRAAEEGVDLAARESPLLAVHNINPRKLGMVERLGGLPVPSIAVINPEHEFTGFGNISLIAPPELVTPSRGTPVFASDVYSSRFPALSDDESKIFRGYTQMGNRRYVPLTLENAVREMKGNPRGAEGTHYGAGSVRAMVTPQFRSMRQMEAERGRIVSPSEFQAMKDEANDRLYALAEKYHPFSIYPGNSTLDFPAQLAEAVRVGFKDLDYNYKDLPPELLQEAREYLSYIKDMPTEYFEAKPQRGIRLGEFQGAVVPMDVPEETLRLLEQSGIKEIEQYDPDGLMALPTRKEATQKFRKQQFKHGGFAVHSSPQLSAKRAA